MDIHIKEVLFAAAGVLLVASPFIWAGVDTLAGHWRMRRAQIADVLRETAEVGALEDAVAIEKARQAELQAVLDAKSPLVLRAEQIVFEEFLRSQKPQA